MGVPSEQIVAVDPNEERLTGVLESHSHAQTFTSLDDALASMAEQGKRVPAIIVASSTAAHRDNLVSIVNAAEAGHLDLSETKIWCEKPVTPSEVFDEIRALIKRHPELDVSVGYILRFSETLSALQTYLTENDLKVTGMEWVYGKDRTKDTRPTQGVQPDEVVHPVSVSDLVLTRVFGEILGVNVQYAEIKRRPFVNREVQDEARLANPDIPKHPTSDVITKLMYAFNSDGTITEVPVSIVTSFLMEENTRRVSISASGPNGDEVLVVDFDTKRVGPDGKPRYTDVLSKPDGTVMYEWSGDKSAAQLLQFLGGLSVDRRPDVMTSLEGESRMQEILSKIGAAAVGPNPNAMVASMRKRRVEVAQTDPAEHEAVVDDLLAALEAASGERYAVGEEVGLSDQLGPILPQLREEVIAMVVTRGTGTLDVVSPKGKRANLAIEPGSIVLLKTNGNPSKTLWVRSQSDSDEELQVRFLTTMRTRRGVVLDAMLDDEASAATRQAKRQRLAKLYARFSAALSRPSSRHNRLT